MWKNIFERYFIALTAIAIIIFGTLGFVFVFRPSLEGFRVARLAANDIGKQYEAVRAKMQEVSDFREQLSQVSDKEIATAQDIFLREPEFARILSVIQKHSLATRFLLSSLQVGARHNIGADKTGLEVVDIQAQFEGGGYRDVKELLRLISVSVPLLETKSFTYSPKSAALTLNLNAFVLPKNINTESTIDKSFFDNEKFKKLRTPTELPKAEPMGRENPFAPVP